MDEDRELVLVSAPNLAGERFMKLLKMKRVPFAALVNNKAECERVTALGAERIIEVNTGEEMTWIVPDASIGNVYLFEKSLNLTCRYLQICRSWTSKALYVITDSHHPRLVYKGLGANYVIFSHSGDVAFLLDGEAPRKRQGG